jgi:hypothetical protein
MEFDSADALRYSEAGYWDELVLHEMLHSIGFGTIWDYKNVISRKSYVGTYGVEEYSVDVGSDVSSVPLETRGGRGTAFAHWSESVFNTELMTGYTESSGPMPLSTISVASLADLGYVVANTPYYGVSDFFG